eukprot:jgi/Tetstr1/434706/TSEL_002533.t1
MPDGEETVVEPTLESLHAGVKAKSTLLRELATYNDGPTYIHTARERVVDGGGAHGSGSGQRIAGQPTGSEEAAERPDLLELAQSARVGAKSVGDEDGYLAVPELLQRAESGYEAVRPVSRVPGLFPLSTDLTNEYLKHDDRRLPALEEYLWMSCFGAHMAALFVALDELLPYVPAANQDFTPYLARARKHAEAIDKAFRFHLAFLRRLNEAKRLHDAGVDEGVAVDAGVAAKDAFGSDELGQRTLDLLSNSLTAQTLKSYAGRLSQFAEFCHDSENISPLEAATATVIRYVAWIGERGHIGAKSLQPYLCAISTFFELHNFDPIAKDSLHLTSARRGLMLRQRRLEAAPLRVPPPADVAYRFVAKAELIVSAPTPEYQHDFRALVASVVNFMFFVRGLTGVSCRVRDVHVDDYNITLQVLRKGAASAANAIGVPLSHIRYQGGWATNSDVVLDYIDPNVLPSPGAWFIFGHIAPLRHFQVQQDSAAVAFPRVVILRPRASGDDGEEKASSSTEDAEPELESWQKSWVRQNPGRSLSEMPAEEPKFNSDNFGTLSILTGGVSFLALAGALWLAQTAQELRSMSPEELAARFGDDLPSEASGMPAGTSTSAPSLTE